MGNEVNKKGLLKDRAYRLSIRLIKFIDKLSYGRSTKIIVNQLLRSGTSIGANIIEAGGASSRKDYCNFFSISLKSAKESIYWLKLLRDANGIRSKELEELIIETDELSRILGASILTLKGKINSVFI